MAGSPSISRDRPWSASPPRPPWRLHQARSASGPEAPAAEAAFPLGPLTCPSPRHGSHHRGPPGLWLRPLSGGRDFVVWKEVSGRLLTPAEIHGLIAIGRPE